MTELGLSFLGGVFVPQAVMSRSVLVVTKYLPTFWFMQANEAIELSGFSGGGRSAVYSSILIQLGFALAIFLAALFLSKERRRAFRRPPGIMPGANRLSGFPPLSLC